MGLEPNMTAPPLMGGRVQAGVYPADRESLIPLIPPPHPPLQRAEEGGETGVESQNG